MMSHKTAIRSYMLQEVANHVDTLTGEVNATGLAEDAFWTLEPDSPLATAPDVYFDIAEEVALRYEIATVVWQATCMAAGLINSRSSDFF